MNKDRDYRNANEVELEDYTITGYATTWDRYKLFEQDGTEYFEQIDRNAFKNADMSDVILQFNHSGTVFARQSNQSLLLEVTDKGLKVTADMSRTTKSREMYESVKEKMITEMSWAFTVENDYYDSENRTRYVTNVKKVFDVSLVDRGANSQTSVTAERSAKSYVLGVEAEQRRIDLKQAQIEYLYTLKRVS